MDEFCQIMLKYGASLTEEAVARLFDSVGVDGEVLCIYTYPYDSVRVDGEVDSDKRIRHLGAGSNGTEQWLNTRVKHKSLLIT